MSCLTNYKARLSFVLISAVFLLSACELVGKKTEVEADKKKPVKEKPVEKEITQEPDYTKLTLEQVHNLPENRACKKLLALAETKLSKRPVVPVKINALKGLSNDVIPGNMYILVPVAEKYPLDDAIRTYKCPEKIEDVRVDYYLKKGPGYQKWYYFSYKGKEKGINARNPVEPAGKITSRYGDTPPEVILQIDKLHVTALKPAHIFADDDISFKFNRIIFDLSNRASFQFYNRGKKELAIRKFEIILGKNTYEVDFKDNIIKLEPGKVFRMNDVEVGISQGKWFVGNANKAVRFKVSIVYKADRQIKKLVSEKYFRVKDLGINAQ